MARSAAFGPMVRFAHIAACLKSPPRSPPAGSADAPRRPASPERCHTFRATGITAYLANGGAVEHAQEMAAHESPRTTKLYDRTKERLTQGRGGEDQVLTRRGSCCAVIGGSIAIRRRRCKKRSPWESSYDAFAVVAVRLSALRLSAAIRPSIPWLFRMAANSEWRIATSLNAPSR
jgi:hypothetical protein